MMVPFSVGLGPQRGCHIAPPKKKYLKYNDDTVDLEISYI